MAVFVLVSGAWHAAWCWERITPLLEAGGHQVIAPDLLGMGEDKTPLSTITLSVWAEQIAGIIRAQPHPVVLAGHSRGGIVISEVAERVPEHIQTLVYVTAVLLPHGASVSAIAPEQDNRKITLEPGPNGTTTVTPQSVQWLYSETPIEWVERALHKLGPEPMAVMATPVSLTNERYGQVPRAYVECSLDIVLPLSEQRRMQAHLTCAPVITLASDHSPFYSEPEKLVEALVNIDRFHAGNN